jgi:dihydroorotate dehydrogenase
VNDSSHNSQQASDSGPIFHLCRAEEWERAEREGSYHGSSQDQADGFIHFSTAEQVVDSAARHRAGQDGLVLVAADPAALGDSLVWEPSRSGKLFPHLYGALPLAAVLSVAPLPLGADGRHRFPAPLLPEPWEGGAAAPAVETEPEPEPAAASLGWRLARPLLHRIDAERAHGLALKALNLGLVRGPGPLRQSVLQQRLWSLDFANPLGLAAGFDKDAAVLDGLSTLGFGFLEVGSITPRPQPGNVRPRLFRLSEDRAVINRMGFNNAGAERAAARLAAWRQQHPKGMAPLVGINLGKNKESADAVADYLAGLRTLGRFADYLVVNVSSPNTPGLRQLQAAEALDPLARALRGTMDQEGPRCPLLLKVAPDLAAEECAVIAEIALAHFHGLIVSNTTTARPPGLQGAARNEAGGLSGRPLFRPSTERLAQFYRLTGGRLPLIGVGGVESAATAYAKIRAGASLVQLYSALVYAGPGLAPAIVQGLGALVERDGFEHVTQAVGVDAK